MQLSGFKVGFAEYGHVIRSKPARYFHIQDGRALAYELNSVYPNFRISSRVAKGDWDGIRIDTVDHDLDLLVVLVTVTPIVSTPIPRLDGSGPVSPLQMSTRYMAPVLEKAKNAGKTIWMVNDTRCFQGARDMAPWTNTLGNFNNVKRRRCLDGWAEDIVKYAYTDTIGLPNYPDPGYHRGGRGVYGIESKQNIDEVIWLHNQGWVVKGKWPTLGIDDPIDVANGELQQWRVVYIPSQKFGAVTLKPWECFANRVAVIANVGYDTHKSLPITGRQRVSLQEATYVAKEIQNDDKWYRNIVDFQWEGYQGRLKKRPHLREIYNATNTR